MAAVHGSRLATSSTAPRVGAQTAQRPCVRIRSGPEERSADSSTWYRASPDSIRSPTMRLVSPLVFPSYCKSAWLTIGFSRAAPGKSHSGETPTTSSPRPRAKQISVAAGRRETIRIGFDRHDSGGTAKSVVQGGSSETHKTTCLSSPHLLPSHHGRENPHVAPSRKARRQHQQGEVRDDEEDDSRGTPPRWAHTS